MDGCDWMRDVTYYAELMYRAASADTEPGWKCAADALRSILKRLDSFAAYKDAKGRGSKANYTQAVEDFKRQTVEPLRAAIRDQDLVAFLAAGDVMIELTNHFHQAVGKGHWHISRPNEHGKMIDLSGP